MSRDRVSSGGNVVPTHRSHLNFLLLVGEDTGRHLACYGDPYARTPQLDRLASEGARYTNAFSHAPVCAPSRGALVSGQYPWSLGIHHMRSTLRHPPRLFTHELVSAGYDVQWPTKMDFNFEPGGDWRSGETEWWETGLPKDRPFFAFCNAFCTHESAMWSERELEWADPAQVPVPPYLPDLPEVRTQIARYYEYLAAQDTLWGQCLEALAASGQAENTIVIYLTDHGRGLPREKRWCYDAGLHLPLIVRWPGRIAAGSVVGDLVSWVDIAPTILSLAGITPPPDYQGQVFLGPEQAEPRKFHFAGRDRMDEAYDCQRVARSRHWHYVRNAFPEIPTARRNKYQEQAPAVHAMREAHAAGTLSAPRDLFFSGPRQAEELYHVATDPDCLLNLADRPENRDVLIEHRDALDSHLEAVGDWGAVPESEMVKRGLVADRIGEYSEWLGQLSPHLAVEPTPTSIEMPRPRADADRVRTTDCSGPL